MSSSKTARKPSKQRRKPKPKNNRTLWIIIGVGIIAAFALIILSRTQSTPTVDGAVYNDLPAEWLNRNELGAPDAPVTVDVWEDFL